MTTFTLDQTSYGIVKVFENRHGDTYPVLPWEPKAAFSALAKLYRTHCQRGRLSSSFRDEWTQLSRRGWIGARGPSPAWRFLALNRAPPCCLARGDRSTTSGPVLP